MDLGLMLKYLKEELDSSGKETLTINFTGDGLEKLLKENKPSDYTKLSLNDFVKEIAEIEDSVERILRGLRNRGYYRSYGIEISNAFESAGFETITKLNLSTRSNNCLFNKGIFLIRQLKQTSKKELMSTRNFGENGYQELIKQLDNLGYSDISEAIASNV